MPDPIQTAAAAPAASFARTNDMNAAILAAFKPFAAAAGVAELQTAILADTTVTVEAANARLLAHLGKDTAPARPAGAVPRIETLADETDKRRDAVSAALLARAGLRVGGTEIDLP